MQNHKPEIKFKKFSNKKKISLQRRLNKLHAHIRAELAGKSLPDAAEIIRQSREKRNKQLLDT